MPNVTVIPATRPIHATTANARAARRRAAAYARVSTDSDEQFTSYEAQVDYYTRYIQSHPDWEFVGVYADEGITGLSTKNRDAFNRMITDALNGRIDIFPRTLIQYRACGNAASGLIQGLSADYHVLPKALLFLCLRTTEWRQNLIEPAHQAK